MSIASSAISETPISDTGFKILFSPLGWRPDVWLRWLQDVNPLVHVSNRISGSPLPMIYWPTKTPAAEIDFGMDWTPTLAELGGASVVASEWEIILGDVVLGVDAISPDGSVTMVRVTGGTAGTNAILQNNATMSDGQIIPSKAYLKIRA